MQYVLVGKEHLITLQFMTDAVHAQTVGAAAKKLVSTARLPELPLARWE